MRVVGVICHYDVARNMAVVITEAEDLVTRLDRKIRYCCLVDVAWQAGSIIPHIPLVPCEVACIAIAVNLLLDSGLQDIVGDHHAVNA